MRQGKELKEKQLLPSLFDLNRAPRKRKGERVREKLCTKSRFYGRYRDREVVYTVSIQCMH